MDAAYKRYWIGIGVLIFLIVVFHKNMFVYADWTFDPTLPTSTPTGTLAPTATPTSAPSVCDLKGCTTWVDSNGNFRPAPGPGTCTGTTYLVVITNYNGSACGYTCSGCNAPNTVSSNNCACLTPTPTTPPALPTATPTSIPTSAPIPTPTPDASTTTYTVTGYVWVDTNSNRIKDGSEVCHSGQVQVRLDGGAPYTYNQDAACTAKYSFPGITSGSHSLSIAAVPNYVFTVNQTISFTLP